MKLYGLAVGALLWAGTALADLKLGVLPRLSPAEMSKMVTPVAQYLEKELGQPVQVVIPKDFQTFVEQAKAGAFDLAYANPGIFMTLVESSKVEPLGVSVEKGTGKTFTGCFVVKEGGGINSLADMKGKKLVFVDEQSPGGYLLQMMALKKAGISKADVTILPFAKKHTNVVNAVGSGVADVGGIRTADFAKIKAENNVAGVKILLETEAIPNWPMFAFPKLGKALTDKAKAALLALPAGSPVLTDMRVENFVATSVADYKVMLELAKP